jgi:hypothetical protein
VFENMPVSDPEAMSLTLSKFVWLRLARGNGLEVKSMTSDLPFLTIKNESQRSEWFGDSNLFASRLQGKAGQGTHSGKLKIETNNSDVKFIEVPIKIVTAK